MLEFHDLPALHRHLTHGAHLADAVVVGLDLRAPPPALATTEVRDAVFLGCELAADTLARTMTVTEDSVRRIGSNYLAVIRINGLMACLMQNAILIYCIYKIHF